MANDIPRANATSNGAADSMALVRQHGVALLEELRRARLESEERMAECGRVDAMKSVRGRTALDDAITQIEELLVALDSQADSAAARSKLRSILVEPMIRTKSPWQTVSATG